MTVPPGKRKTLPVETYRQAFAYIFEGSGDFAGASEPFGVLHEQMVDGEEVLVRDPVGNRSLVVFDSGDEVSVQAGEQGMRFLLVSGRPMREPVAWHGPIVMNTQDEIRQALDRSAQTARSSDAPEPSRGHGRAKSRESSTRAAGNSGTAGLLSDSGLSRGPDEACGKTAKSVAANIKRPQTVTACGRLRPASAVLKPLPFV